MSITTISGYYRDKEKDNQDLGFINILTNLPHPTMTLAISCQNLLCYQLKPHKAPRKVLSAQFTVNKISLERLWGTLCVFCFTGCPEGSEECQDGLQQTGPVQDAFRMGSPVSQNSLEMFSYSLCVLSITIFNLFVLFHRPVFRDASGTLDKSARFSALYRQDSNKLSEEDLFKLLADFRKSVFTSSHQSCLHCDVSCPFYSSFNVLKGWLIMIIMISLFSL